jgi:hypothetical protein
VQREHADLVVFPAVAGHLAATGKEHEIRGAVPLFDHVQAVVDLAAQRFRMQILTEEDRLNFNWLSPGSGPTSQIDRFSDRLLTLHRLGATETVVWIA